MHRLQIRLVEQHWRRVRGAGSLQSRARTKHSFDLSAVWSVAEERRYAQCTRYFKHIASSTVCLAAAAAGANQALLQELPVPPRSLRHVLSRIDLSFVDDTRVLDSLMHLHEAVKGVL